MMRLALALLLCPALAAADPLPRVEATPFAPFLTAQSFTCGGKTCKQMGSCAEACHALLVCGQSARDRDKDGIPCENVCSAPC